MKRVIRDVFPTTQIRACCNGVVPAWSPKKTNLYLCTNGEEVAEAEDG